MQEPSLAENLHVKAKIDRVELFFDSLTKNTRLSYSYHIPLVLGEDLKGFVANAKQDPEEAETFLLRWLADAKKGKIKKKTHAGVPTSESLSNQSIRTYIKETKSLLTFCKTGVDFSEIVKQLPKKNKPKHKAPDIAPIRKLFEILNIRQKFIVSLMVSSGVRVGFWDYATLQDLVELSNGLGKLVVYRNEPEEYECLVSSECMYYFKEYLKVRIESGEVVKPNSPLLRAVFDDRRDYAPSTDIVLRATSNSVKLFLSDYWRKIPVERNWKQAHGFRHFFKTTLEEVGEMKSLYVETLMGHRKKNDDPDEYNRPKIEKLAEIYLKHVHLLTINETTELKGKLAKTEEEKLQIEDTYYIRTKRLEDEVTRLTKDRENDKKVLAELLETVLELKKKL